MKPEKILAEPPRVLDQQQRKHFFEKGYLLVKSAVSEEWVNRLRDLSLEFVERSRKESESGRDFDLAPGHSASSPSLRRLKRPDDQHPLFWQFVTEVLPDYAADLVGPDVTFHHSKLNFKWGDEKDEVKWHQDIQFYPQTNYSSLTIGLLLEDTGLEDGAVAVIPGSHEGPLYDLYGEEGQWCGHLMDSDVETLDLNKVVYLTGPAGSLTIHNCRTVHSSLTSNSEGIRPLLLNCFNSVDAKPYTPHPDPSGHSYEVICGRPARWAEHDPRPCLIPPDWSGGYTSIFSAQAGEKGAS